MIPIVRPTLPDMQRVIGYLKLSKKAGRFSNFGPAERLFTERLTQEALLHERRRMVLTSSGHTALMTAYAVLDVRRPVIPAFTFESTRAAAVLQGVEPLIVDVNPTSGCLTVDILQQLDADSYDSVVAVCALSTVPDLGTLAEFCSAHGKRLIIDGAATWGTPGLANYGDAYCYSFHATKTLSAGEGGALVVNEEHYDKAMAYINFGRTPDKRVIINNGRAINGKMSEYAAAVGLSSLDDIDETARMHNADIYLDLLLQHIPIAWESWTRCTTYAFMPLFAPTAEKATAVRSALTTAGIANLAYYPPLEPRPVSDDLYARNVCLPVHSGVSPSMVAHIAATVHEAMK